MATPAPSAIELVAGWSRDGQRLAVSGGAPFHGAPPGEPTGYAGLYVVTADGSGRTRLANVPFNVAVGTGGAAWSPDGRQLALSVSDNGGTKAAGAGIWLVNTDGAGATQVPGTADASWGLAWAPDGRRIAYNTARDNPLAIVRVPEGDPPTYPPRPAGETWDAPSWRHATP